MRRQLLVAVAAGTVAVACTHSVAPDDVEPVITVTTLELEPFVTIPGDSDDEEPRDPEDPVGLEEIVAFAERTELDTVVALDDNTVHVAFLDSGLERAGATHEVAPLGWAWSDGAFVFQWVDVGGGMLESTVAEFDGTVLCAADGSAHHFTPGDSETGVADVMSVEASPAAWDEGEGDDEFAIPLFDVDCQSGDLADGEPVSFRSSDGFRFIKTAGPRTFTGIRGTNGITDLLDSVGASVNREDAAIDHSFNADATLVAYGMFESDDDPSIVTDVIRVRAVDTGEVLWTAKLPFPFTFLHFAGDRLVIGQPEIDARQGGTSTTSVLILDVVDATLLGHHAAPFEILSVGP